MQTSLKDRYPLCYPAEIVKNLGKYFVNKDLSLFVPLHNNR